MKAIVRKVINRLIATRGLTITRIGETLNSSSLGYISAKETDSAAEAAGLSVCDYVEKLWAKQGDTQRAIEQMASCGAFATANPYIVEIGTGTGRYLEKVLQRVTPAKYESYETAKDWAEWLQSKYPIISHEADGVTLKQTPGLSADLVHDHGVFVYLPFFISYRYWKEILRIKGENGVVVFDIISEKCLDEQTVDKWLNSKHNYPCFLSKPYVVSLFSDHGFLLVDSFNNRYGEGYSEYLLFTRNKPAQPSTTLLLHLPIYDCATDVFELPCAHPDFEDKILHNDYGFNEVEDWLH